MTRWNPLYFVVVALIAMAPVAAFADRKDDDDDSRRSDRGSSRSVLLKKDHKYSIWDGPFDFGFSKDKDKNRNKNKNNDRDRYSDRDWDRDEHKDKDKKKGRDYSTNYPVRPKPYCPPSETPIPEPSAALLFAAGAGVVALRLRGGRR